MVIRVIKNVFRTPDRWSVNAWHVPEQNGMQAEKEPSPDNESSIRDEAEIGYRFFPQGRSTMRWSLSKCDRNTEQA
jgi:hypothetical protein